MVTPLDISKLVNSLYKYNDHEKVKKREKLGCDEVACGSQHLSSTKDKTFNSFPKIQPET